MSPFFDEKRDNARVKAKHTTSLRQHYLVQVQRVHLSFTAPLVRVRDKRFHGARQTNSQAIRGMRFFRTATKSVIGAPHDGNLRTSHQVQTSAASQHLPLKSARNTVINLVIGLVPLTFRSLNSFMRPFVRKRRGFCHPAMNGGGADLRGR